MIYTYMIYAYAYVHVIADISANNSDNQVQSSCLIILVDFKLLTNLAEAKPSKRQSESGPKTLVQSIPAPKTSQSWQNNHLFCVHFPLLS